MPYNRPLAEFESVLPFIFELFDMPDTLMLNELPDISLQDKVLELPPLKKIPLVLSLSVDPEGPLSRLHSTML